MGEDLYIRLQHAAEKIGEADSTVIRLTLRAGLSQLERENYELFELKNAPKKKTGQRVRSATGEISSRTVLHGANEQEGTYKTKGGRK
jgi:hypothetical protein